ncbi:MAG: hypothetical protein DLM57_02715 [Pseudonocardiales bacterium]|nr:MAG: hypothetical protein DLM57_02715 [Pseudonocardiales bacterium]
MDTSVRRAQHGEDVLLAERFSAKHGGGFVEVGALDGDFLSNSYYFEKALNWTGVLIEANPSQAELCRRNRPRSQVVNCAVVAPGAPPNVAFQVAEGNEAYSTLSPNRLYAGLLRERNISTTGVVVPAATLDTILENAQISSIDFVTIDVEGHEHDVVRGFDLRRWSPTVVLVESAGGAPNIFIALRMFRAGYARSRRVVINDWYEPAPPFTRVRRLVVSFVVSVPDIARMLVRESLRSAGVLDGLRVRRARRRTR